MIWPGTHGYYAARPWVLHYAGPSEAVAEVIEQFGRTQSQWLSIRLYTWRGEWYATWLTVPGSGPGMIGDSHRDLISYDPAMLPP